MIRLCIPCGHKMVEVVCAHKGLDLAPLLQLLLAHALGYLAGISVDASNQGMSEGMVLGSLIVVL